MRPVRCVVRPGWLLATVICIGSLGEADVWAQQRLYLQVVDSLGAIVTDLGPEEIVVHENDRERPVVDATLANLPIKLTVLVDNSDAAADSYVYLRDGLRAFFRRLPPNQMASLLTMARQPRWVVRPTTDIAELIQGVDEVAPDRGSGLRLLDALIEATKRVDDDEERHRPVIVIFTALGIEHSNINRNRYRDFLRDVQRTGITIHSLQLTQPRERGAVALQSQITQDMRTLTGGYYQTTVVASGIDERFVEIADVIGIRNRELSRQILVTYERPTNEEEPVTEVSVELLRPALSFRLTFDGRIAEREQ